MHEWLDLRPQLSNHSVSHCLGGNMQTAEIASEPPLESGHILQRRQNRILGQSADGYLTSLDRNRQLVLLHDLNCRCLRLNSKRWCVIARLPRVQPWNRESLGARLHI